MRNLKNENLIRELEKKNHSKKRKRFEIWIFENYYFIWEI